MPRLLPQGIGKRVTVDQFRLQKRGGVGLKSIRLNDGDALAAINTVTHFTLSVTLQCIADPDGTHRPVSKCQDVSSVKTACSCGTACPGGVCKWSNEAAAATQANHCFDFWSLWYPS